PAIEQRERHLVRDDRHAVLDEQAEMIAVEVRHAELADPTLAAQSIELEHGVDVSGMPIVPPVELQQVDTREAEALQTLLDPFANDTRRHRPGKRAPLGECPRAGGVGLRDISAD